MSDGFNAVDGELTLALEGQAVGSIANNLTTDVEGFALDARQGKALDEKKLDVSRVMNNRTTVLEGYALDARQGKWLDENKVGFADVANNLTTDDKNKVLSAAQGAALKGLIDGKVTTKSVSLASGSWSDLKQTVSVSGVTSDSIVLVTPAPASYTAYHGSGVYCSAQGSGTLTFTAVNKPTSKLTVNLLLIS